MIKPLKNDKLICLGIVIALIGCARTEWINPAVPPGQWEQIKVNCAIEAMREIPPNYTYSVNPGISQQNESCHHDHCTNNGTYIPPTVSSHDANDGLRQQATEACYMRNGGYKQTD